MIPNWPDSARDERPEPDLAQPRLALTRIGLPLVGQPFYPAPLGLHHNKPQSSTG